MVAQFATSNPFRLELYPWAGRPAQPPKGTRPVHTGIPEFDGQYLAHSNDPQIASDVLRVPSVRAALDELRRLAPPHGMLASVNPERLLVQVDRNLGASAPSLEAAVRDALIIHDYLRAGVTRRIGDGVEIVAAGPAAPEDAGPPVCKVCGDAIVAEFVYCGQCRTPHHRDCWTFVGGCSIFGCQGKHCTSA
ncbi:MAG: RING finger protein [Isosphaeraceae bacterium]